MCISFMKLELLLPKKDNNSNNPYDSARASLSESVRAEEKDQGTLLHR